MTRHWLDPDDTLAQFRATRHTIAEAITAYTADENRTETPGETADHHDRLEELYREASDLMAALDEHLATEGALPAAWTRTTETRTGTPESRHHDMSSHPRPGDFEDGTGELARLDMHAVLGIRDAAAHSGDLVRALLADNVLEDWGGLAGTGEGRRRTCRACRTWADHLHDPLTGQTMRVAGRWPTEFTPADVAAAADLAAQVFALASVAPPEQWQHLADGSHRITVACKTTHVEIRVPADTEPRPIPPYIQDYRLHAARGPRLRLPLVYANPRAAAAITDARRHLTPRRRR
ncbi:hypothetical protein [Nocardia vaccinii]|uniref:hypothetical protein n=1 Tax=Nocardia vaccinii TaxID=1822 RepID=UPI000833FEDE|nr:hypothetical protein [Nocardia vaccinii]